MNAIIQSRWLKWLATLVMLVALIIFPHFLNLYYLRVATITGIWIIFALSMGLLRGYLGELNFGHAAFLAIGAYSSALLTMRLGVNFWVSIPLSILITVIFALLIGYPALRTRAHYFALVTLGFGEIVRIFLINLDDLTGGPIGIRGIPNPDSILGIDFTQRISMYYMVLVFVVLIVVISVRIVNSYLGHTFTAIREDFTLAQYVGIDVTKYKIINFMISGGMAALAGVLLAHLTRAINPAQFGIETSAGAVLMVVIGGSGTIVGPIIGAVFVSVLPELLAGIARFNMIIYGALLILSIIFFPDGFVGIARMLMSKVTGIINRYLKPKTVQSDYTDYKN